MTIPRKAKDPSSNGVRSTIGQVLYIHTNRCQKANDLNSRNAIDIILHNINKVVKRFQAVLRKYSLNLKLNIVDNGLSPNGKAQDFDSCIYWFESS